jgi:vancomycin permeability regulator SanA
MKKILLRTIALLLIAFIFSAAAIVWDGLQDEIGRADVAIVLGNAVRKNGQPSARLQARLDKAVELYQQGLFPDLIVSGGAGQGGLNEAEVMKKYLVSKGLPEDHIIVDDDGANTYLTAKNAARIMREKGLRSAIVISQYFHLSRAKLALKRFGVATVYTAHPRFFEMRDFYSIAREVIGYYAYLCRSYQ